MKKHRMMAASLIVAAGLFWTNGVTAQAQQIQSIPSYGFVQEEKGVKWKNMDGTWAKECWVGILGLIYYVNKDGYIQVGLTKVDGKSYFLNADGTMTKGWLAIGDGIYFFKEDGTMAANEAIGQYEFARDGKLITATNPVSEVATLVSGVISSVTTQNMTADQKLQACYQYMLDHCSYKRTYDTPSGDWTGTYATEILSTGQGNCYRYAAAFAYLAKGLGFESRVITGQISARKGGTTPHAWTEVKIGDTWYIFDSEMQDAKNKDYYWKTYSNYPTKPLIKEKEWEVNF